MECSICIEIVNEDSLFNCNACKYKNCIDCHKKYLITSTQDPHCINCRAIIPFDIFLNKFNQKWVFSKYKQHKYNILLDRETSLIPQTVQQIGFQKQKDLLLKKKDEIYKKYCADIKIINDELESFGDNKNKVVINKFQYTYACPKETCKGFLNKDNICDLCDMVVCKKCYCEIDKDLKGPHECNEAMVETFNAIKKEAKPCPSCGEFISKISGCDQMFCTKCGTAFSWKSGLVEKGIIHNPHAHTFFLNNPIAQNNANPCRGPIPSNNDMNIVFTNTKIDVTIIAYLRNIYRRLSEFRQYYRIRLVENLNNNAEQNQDLRIKYIKNQIDKKSFEKTLHARDKKANFRKELKQNLLFTYDIAEIILWNICDESKKKQLVEKNVELLKQLSTDFNTNTYNLCEKFGYLYQNIYILNNDYQFPHTFMT